MSTYNSEGLTPIVEDSAVGCDPDSPETDGLRETRARPTTSVHPQEKIRGRFRKSSKNQWHALNDSAEHGGYAERIALLEAAVEQLSRAYSMQSEALRACMQRLDGVEAYLALRAQVEAANGVQLRIQGVTIQ